VRHILVAASVSLLGLVGVPALADASHQWALSYLKADQTWHVSKGDGVVVAVIDSGVQPNSDLQSNLLAGADFSSDGLTDTDAVGHGTGIAALIGGSGQMSNGAGTIGLAPSSEILAVRASTDRGAGLAFALTSAIDYATARAARVINLSVGNTANDPAIHTAIQNALNHDIVVVAAVGNDSTSSPRYPAAYPGVLGVGAIDSAGTVWAKSNSGPDVSLVAPGVHIYRDDNQGRQGYSDGTSEATAYVSAAAALVRSAHPTWTAPQVVAALTSTADKPAALHGAVRDDQYGYGILNVLAALKLSTPPAVDSQSSSASAAPSPPAASGVANRGVASSPFAQDPHTAAASASSASHHSSSTPALLIAGAALVVAAFGIIAYSLRRSRRRTH
jgi:type VII secretion-associated serine protease mycosin